ncbi:MAG: DUF4349 domain-containing protein [Treponema sp.]|nr:DUF4349 domain-containing protein [Treponema sp.]
MNFKKIIFSSSLVLGLFITLSSCSKSGSGRTVQESARETKAFAAPKMAVKNEMFSDTLYESEEMMMLTDSVSESGTVPVNYERKIVRKGNISLEVESLDESQNKISEWAKKYGGYITYSYESESSAHYTVKIPSEKFDEAFNESKTYGKYKNGNINSDDITDQYYDLETRLEAKKILRDRLTGYLSNAKETKELLNIERELNNAVSEIESMEGRLNRMKDQVAFSTLDINLELPFRQTEEGFIWPSWSDGFRHFISNILDYFIGFTKILCYIAICGTPIVAVLAFLFWILFGKIGLLKKLFKKLK